MEKTMKRLLGIVMLAMVGLGASAQEEQTVQVNVDFSEFTGGTVTEKSQVATEDGNSVVVTITVKPADGYYISKKDIVVVPTRPVSARKKANEPENPSLAEALELTGEDPADLTAERDYSFTVAKELGAWVIEANFHLITTSGTIGENDAVAWDVKSETVGEGDEAKEVKTLTFTGDAAIPAIDASAPWEMLKAKITNVVIGEGITAISDGLFSGFTSLTGIQILNGSQIIGLDENAIPAGVTIDVPGNLYNEYTATEGWKALTIGSKNAIPMTGVEFGAKNSYDAYVSSVAVKVPSVLNAMIVTSIEKNALVTEDIKDGVIPANTPVLLLSKEQKGNDFRTAAAPEQESLTKGGATENLLKAAPVGGQEVKLGEVYLLYNDVFYLSQAGTIAEGGIYLAIPEEKGETKARRSYALSLNGTATGTTGIDDFSADAPAAPVWYSLDGIRHNGLPTQKGFSIMNRKIVVTR